MNKLYEFISDFVIIVLDFSLTYSYKRIKREQRVCACLNQLESVARALCGPQVTCKHWKWLWVRSFCPRVVQDLPA